MHSFLTEHFLYMSGTMLHVGEKVTKKTQELPLELTLVGKTNKKNKCRISTSTETVTGFYASICLSGKTAFPQDGT